MPTTPTPALVRDPQGDEGHRVSTQPTGDRDPGGMERMRTMDALRSPLCVALVRVQLLQRRLHRGADPARVAADLEAIEAAVVRLAALADRIERGGADPG